MIKQNPGESRGETGRRVVLLGRFRSAALFFFAILFLSLFHGPLFRNRQFGYRDAAYFYYPLYRQVQDSFDAGRIPLWDPYENLGQPLAANPAAAVFYPLKAIFFLPSILPVDYDFCFKAFILIHVVLTFFFFYLWTRTRFPGRRPLLSPSGGIFAALAWTFGGSILFQTSNPIFLVGATWIPLLFACGLRLFHSPNGGNLVAAAVVLFMMLTGGDPQSAYLGSLLLFLFLLCCHWRKEADFGRRGLPGKGSVPRKRGGWILFISAVMLAVGLGAIQIFPSIEMVRHSSRMESTGDRTIGSSHSRIDRFLCRDLENGGHSWATYNFSVPPWRSAEFLWPNVGGREFPENARWFSSLPNDSRVWSPSLYLGLYPFLFAVSAALFFRRRRPDANSDDYEGAERERWRLFFTWMSIAAFLAAWGGFGIGWLGRVLLDSKGGMADWEFRNGDPVGGVYWLLTRILPGFASFRYPAKMMTFVSFGLAILAGFGWDRLWFADRIREKSVSNGTVFRSIVLGLAVVSLAGLFWILLGNPASFWTRITGVDPFSSRTIYGPCDVDLTRRSVEGALLQTAILAGILYVFLHGVTKRRKERWDENGGRARFGRGVLLTAVCVDLYLAQAWLIADAPRGVFRTKSPMTNLIRANSDAGETPRFKPGEGDGKGGEDVKAMSSPSSPFAPPIRLFRDPFLYPAQFVTQTSPTRLTERILWDRVTLFQKNSFSDGIANVDVRGTFVAGDFLPISHYLRNELRRYKKTGRVGVGMERLLAAFGVDVLMTSDGTIPRSESLREMSGGGGDETTDRRGGGQGERNGKSRRKKKGDAGETPNQWPKGAALRKIADGGRRIRILHSTERLRDWRDIVRFGIPDDERAGENAAVTLFTPERIEMNVTLRESGTLLVAEEFYPGWRGAFRPVSSKKTPQDGGPEASVSEEKPGGETRIPVRKIASCLRAIDLPAGEFHVVMEYRPRSFAVGAIVSALTWGGVGLFFIGKGLSGKSLFRRGVKRFRRPSRKRKFPPHAGA